MSSPDIYESLGIRPIINAGGHMTILGGSVLSPEVREAMESANTAYTMMDDVFDGAGKAIADMLGTGGGFGYVGVLCGTGAGGGRDSCGNRPGEDPPVAGHDGHEGRVSDPEAYALPV